MILVWIFMRDWVTSFPTVRAVPLTALFFMTIIVGSTTPGGPTTVSQVAELMLRAAGDALLVRHTDSSFLCLFANCFLCILRLTILI